MLAAADALAAAAEEMETPVLPPLATVFEERLELANPIEIALMPQLHPGRFVATPSVVTNMGAAMGVNYTSSMSMRLWKHFNTRRGAAPVPATHTYVSALKVLYLHEDVARIFAIWLEARGSEKRAETERKSKKRAVPTTTGPAAAAVSSSSASSPDSTSSPSMPLQEIDTNIMPHAAASQPKLAKCARIEKDYEEEEEGYTRALAVLKRRIAALRENAKFWLNFTNKEFLPADETAAELTDLLLSYETVVVSRALKDVDEYLKQYCPEAISKVNWTRLSFRKSAAPTLPDVEQIFSMQPIPCPVPLSK